MRLNGNVVLFYTARRERQRLVKTVLSNRLRMLRVRRDDNSPRGDARDPPERGG